MPNRQTRRRCGGSSSRSGSRSGSRSSSRSGSRSGSRSSSRTRSSRSSSPKYEDVDVSKLMLSDKDNLFPDQTYFVVNKYTGKRTPAKFVRYPKTRYTQYMDGEDTSNAVFSHKGRKFQLERDEFDAYEVNSALRIKGSLPPDMWRNVSEILYRKPRQR